jgi:hypothetical protein
LKAIVKKHRNEEKCMRYSTKINLLALLLIFVIGWQVKAQKTDERPLLFAHYMPWYQMPDVSGYWGWHWTMEHFNPENVDANGRREIASHYMPLTGAYDSQDEAVLEYQVLLMKLSGIDGVIVDWYGIEDFRDYAVLNAATEKLFEYTQRAGLQFALAYEDVTVRFMVNENHITSDEAHSRAQEDMLHAQNWFSSEGYLRYNEQPLLFVFGPQYFRSPADWETIFSVLDTAPALVTLDGHMDFAALSSYPWLPMEFAGGATLAPTVLQSYLERFYRNAQRRDYIVGGAFPAFHDIYSEADVRSSYGYLDPQHGDTLRLTLDLALQNNVDLIQLITWNDYGEGTMLEPTEEYGYQYLEIVQETRRTLSDDFTFTADDLRLPFQLFELRKANPDNPELDEVFAALINGDIESAQTLLSN